jgi:hypothetical protein
MCLVKSIAQGLSIRKFIGANDKMLDIIVKPSAAGIHDIEQDVYFAALFAGHCVFLF